MSENETKFCAICGASDGDVVHFDVVVRWLRERVALKRPRSDDAHAACVRQTLPNVGVKRITWRSTQRVRALADWYYEGEDEPAIVVGSEYELVVNEWGERLVYPVDANLNELVYGGRFPYPFAADEDLRSIFTLI